jgi:hypothetical protein
MALAFFVYRASDQVVTGKYDKLPDQVETLGNGGYTVVGPSEIPLEEAVYSNGQIVRRT